VCGEVAVRAPNVGFMASYASYAMQDVNSGAAPSPSKSLKKSSPG
jgi:hypothetical protein